MNKQDKIGIAVIAVLIILLIVYMSLYHVDEIPEKDWREFHKRTGQEIMMLATKLFFYTGYELGKNGKKTDCNGAVEGILEYFGAKIKDTNAWGHGQALQKYGFKRAKLKDVRERDIVVFRKNKKGIGHIAIVVKVGKDKLYYFEHTRQTEGFNYTPIDFYNWRIYGVYFVTPTYFYGEDKV